MYIYRPIFNQLSITPAKVYAEMGYRETQPEWYIKELTGNLLKEFSDTIVSTCFFDIYDGKVEDKSVILNNGTVFQVNDVLSTLMYGSVKFAIFASTAGIEFQYIQDRLKTEGDMLKIFIVDSIGSCIAESAGDYLESKLKEETGSLKHTNRFSPGYCGWNLTEQKKLFHLFGNQTYDITLSESCLMIPIKSISGIIGIGENVNEKKYACQYCTMDNCYRKRQ